jgi:hypothetical protein
LGQGASRDSQARYAELSEILKKSGEPPTEARRLRAEWRFRDDDLPRFRADSTDYVVRWQ